MKHTKGKWVVYPRWSYRKGVSAKDTTQNEPDGYSVEAQRDAYRNDISIASIQTYSDGKRPMDEVQANANLIASAPEMLEVLKEVVPLFHLMRRFFFKRGISLSDDKVGAGFAFQRLIEKADELIAKAEGETEKAIIMEEARVFPDEE